MAGRRKGQKRSDRRWIAEDGSEWDSKFEWSVFEGLRSNGYRVRRCNESDSIAYHSPVKQGRCLECGSSSVVQERTYTADLYVVEGTAEDPGCKYLIECKGYFPSPKRSLFRALSAGLQGTGLRIVFESNQRLRGTKMTPVEYIQRYCKNVIPGVWDKKNKQVVWYE